MNFISKLSPNDVEQQTSGSHKETQQCAYEVADFRPISNLTSDIKVEYFAEIMSVLK